MHALRGITRARLATFIAAQPLFSVADALAELRRRQADGKSASKFVGVFEGFVARYRSEDGVLVWAIMLGEGTDPAILGWQPAAASGGGGDGGGALVLAGTRERGSSVVIGEGVTARVLPAAAARAGFVAVISAQGSISICMLSPFSIAFMR